MLSTMLGAERVAKAAAEAGSSCTGIVNLSKDDADDNMRQDVERFGLVESMKKMARRRKEEIKWRSQDKGNIVHALC